jgi:sec-independent protein translocase protein TatB
MFDLSWGEVMVIGGVALIVIGPKDLPKALRTVGQVTGKLRRMAAEFQSQFNEAMREAELDEVKKELEGVNRSVGGLNTTFDPIRTVRDELQGAIERQPSPATTTTAGPPVPSNGADAHTSPSDASNSEFPAAPPPPSMGPAPDRPGEPSPGEPAVKSPPA